MKIKKTLFTTELEITPDELERMRFQLPSYIGMGLFIWIKKVLGLDMLPQVKKKEEEEDETS